MGVMEKLTELGFRVATIDMVQRAEGESKRIIDFAVLRGVGGEDECLKTIVDWIGDRQGTIVFRVKPEFSNISKEQRLTYLRFSGLPDEYDVWPEDVMTSYYTRFTLLDED
jgi:hypothetical protein